MGRLAVVDGASSPVTRPRGRVRALPVAVVALTIANVAILWIVRGEFVCGWDTVGASFGVLALNRGSFLDGVRTIGTAVLSQRGRPVFTGGESFLYGFVPGMLANLWPWVLWGNLVAFVLFAGVSAWLVRRLGGRWWIFAGCVLASPALTSQSMVGYPYLASNTLAYGLAIGWVLSSRPRDPVVGGLLDIVVFAAITAIAFQGYESAKTFFIVPVIAAVAKKGVPLWRCLLWVGCAGAIAWLVHDQAAGTTLGALSSIPHDPATFSRGVLRAAHAYFLDTYIDFPALAVAAAIALPFLRRDRPFWSVLFVAICGLVSLNAFEFDGGFLVPHRFLLLGLVSALIVTLLLSDGVRGPGLVVAALVAVGMSYSTWRTVDFALHRPRDASPKRAGYVYALPYNHMKVDGPISPERIRDAMTLARLGREERAHQVVLYGASVEGESIVNPQWLLPRVLLSVGYQSFMEQFTFVDHSEGVYFALPIRRPGELGMLLPGLRTPFLLHVLEPEYSADAVIAKYLNRSEVTPVNFGLYNFRSFRVDAFTPPGPVAVPPLRVTPTNGRRLANGFCRTSWRQENPLFSPLVHWAVPTEQHVERRLGQALDLAPRDLDSSFFREVARAHVAAIAEPAPASGVVHFRGYFDNDTGQPLQATLTVSAPDEVAIVVNGLPIEEAILSRPLAEYHDDVLLPPGRNELVVFHHRFSAPGDVTVTSVDGSGHPLAWQCDADLSSATDHGP